MAPTRFLISFAEGAHLLARQDHVLHLFQTTDSTVAVPLIVGCRQARSSAPCSKEIVGALPGIAKWLLRKFGRTLVNGGECLVAT
jgi:hypothetical protein